MVTLLINTARSVIATRLPRGSLRDRLARGSFWSLAGTITAQGLGLLASVAVARLLGRTVFGEFGMIQNTVSMFGILAGCGLGVTATKHIAEYRTHDKKRAGRILGMTSVFSLVSAAVLTAVLLVASPVISSGVLNAAHLSFPLRIGAALLFFSTLFGVQTASLAGLEAFKAVAALRLRRGVLTLPLVVVGAYFWRLGGALAGVAAAMTITWVAGHVRLRREGKAAGIRIDYARLRSMLPVFWTFSLPAFMGGVMAGPVMWVARALLARQVDGYDHLGVFTAAYSLTMLITLLPGMISNVSLPILCELRGTAQFDRYRRALLKLIGLYAAFCFAAVAILCVLSPTLMGAYGADFRNGWPTLCVLAIALALATVTSVIGQAIVASGRIWWGFGLNVIWAGELLIASWWLAPYGALGLSVAFLLAYALHMCQVGIFVMFVLRRSGGFATSVADD